MNKKLVVTNLPLGVEEGQIQALFSGNGRAVSSVRILNYLDPDSTERRAMVEMDSVKDAQSALELLNGHEFLGRSIHVTEAKSH